MASKDPRRTTITMIETMIKDIQEEEEMATIEVVMDHIIEDEVEEEEEALAIIINKKRLQLLFLRLNRKSLMLKRREILLSLMIMKEHLEISKNLRKQIMSRRSHKKKKLSKR